MTNRDSLTRLGVMMIKTQALFVLVLNRSCRGLSVDESQGQNFCCSGHL